jgi:hypothetical protein
MPLVLFEAMLTQLGFVPVDGGYAHPATGDQRYTVGSDEPYADALERLRRELNE